MLRMIHSKDDPCGVYKVEQINDNYIFYSHLRSKNNIE